MTPVDQICELLWRMECSSASDDPAKLQTEIDGLITDLLAKPQAKHLTRHTLMAAIQVRYRKYAREMEKRGDAARRGDVV